VGESRRYLVGGEPVGSTGASRAGLRSVLWIVADMPGGAPYRRRRGGCIKPSRTFWFFEALKANSFLCLSGHHSPCVDCLSPTAYNLTALRPFLPTPVHQRSWWFGRPVGYGPDPHEWDHLRAAKTAGIWPTTTPLQSVTARNLFQPRTAQVGHMDATGPPRLTTNT
jgi:hypothetical protein